MRTQEFIPRQIITKRMCGIVMARGRSDKIALFASPPELATEIGVRSTFNVIRELISNAKETIFITCYEFSSEELTDEIIKAANRDIWIDLYIDETEKKSSSNKPNRITRSKDCLRRMEDAGVAVKRNKNLMTNHTKAIIADSEIGVIGSANFTYSGLNKNIEVGILVEGATCRIFVDKFIHGLEAMIEDE